jgi:hypothetical protein
MSEDEEIVVNINNDDELRTPLEEAIEDSPAQPVEVIREEIVAVADPDREISVSASPWVEEEEAKMNSSDNDENIYEQLKAQSIQISRLTEIVESLQSQIKQLQVIRSGGRRTTVAKRKRIQTKKKSVGRKNKRIAKRSKKK